MSPSPLPARISEQRWSNLPRLAELLKGAPRLAGGAITVARVDADRRERQIARLSVGGGGDALGEVLRLLAAAEAREGPGCFRVRTWRSGGRPVSGVMCRSLDEGRPVGATGARSRGDSEPLLPVLSVLPPRAAPPTRPPSGRGEPAKKGDGSLRAVPRPGAASAPLGSAPAVPPRPGPAGSGPGEAAPPTSPRPAEAAIAGSARQGSARPAPVAAVEAMIGVHPNTSRPPRAPQEARPAGPPWPARPAPVDRRLERQEQQRRLEPLQRPAAVQAPQAPACDARPDEQAGVAPSAEPPRAPEASATRPDTTFEAWDPAPRPCAQCSALTARLQQQAQQAREQAERLRQVEAGVEEAAGLRAALAEVRAQEARLRQEGRAREAELREEIGALERQHREELRNLEARLEKAEARAERRKIRLEALKEDRERLLETVADERAAKELYANAISELASGLPDPPARGRR